MNLNNARYVLALDPSGSYYEGKGHTGWCLLDQETNKIVAVFNANSEAVKLNQSMLTNIGMNCFIKQLEKLTEEEIIEYLTAKALEEAKK